jgi:hypothetical protein
MLGIVAPEAVRLPLSDGDWIDVRKRLNHGEHSRMLERLFILTPEGEARRDPLKWADVIVTTYLLDWSLSDPAKGRLGIRDQPLSAIQAALDLIDPDDFAEVREAVETHASAVARAMAEKKRRRTGESASSPTSPSLVAVTGAMSG